MVFLLVYFLFASKDAPHFRHWISAALLFSWLGDIFLLNEGESFFIAGLASFLLAHICYIFFFINTRKMQSPPSPWNIPVLAALALYVGIFYFFLAPHLNLTLKIPVFVYALTIATMFVLAYHAFQQKNTGVALYCIIGAALFIVSDSMLAINSFVSAFSGAGIAIMGTYILAQLAIVLGATQLVKAKFNKV
jgi:uncharacterized membrane protein YhhN